MADNNEDTLRRSLDVVDRQRNRLVVGLGATIVLLLFVFGAGALHSDDSSMRAVILSHYFLLVIWVTALILIVIIQITVMTKRILRAIELSAKK